MINTFFTAKKDFNAAIENAAERFARDCWRLTPCAARNRIRPVLQTIAFIYGEDIDYVTCNFECATIDYGFIVSDCSTDIWETGE